MGSDGIYRKTEKGRTEIATRANKLGMRERTMLIMVDDKTSRSALLVKNTHPGSGDILDLLLAGGFIEIAAGTEATAPPAAAAAGAAAPVEVSLESARRYACRALVTYLGPSADDLTVMVEKSKSLPDLIASVEKTRDIIQAMAGRKKADEYRATVMARMPAA